MDDRLPARLEVSALLRAVNAAGGFAAVLAKGEPDAGTILIICCENDTNVRVYERMPTPGRERPWTLSKSEATETKEEIASFWRKRRSQDPDLWVVELDIANAERFIGLTGTQC